MSIFKKESLMDFVRSEASLLQMMNDFLSVFHEGDLIYACRSNEGHIPGYTSGKYEVTKIVPAKYRIQRPLFKEPKLIIDQKPELWTRTLGGISQSRSSVNNYHREEYGPSDKAYDQIIFSQGSAYMHRGHLSVLHSTKLKIFGSTTAFQSGSRAMEQYKTLEEFEAVFYPNNHYVIARISQLPVLCFPA